MRAKIREFWRRERLGLTMIVGSIAAIAVAVFLLLDYQGQAQLAHMREQGSSISRLLADVPFTELGSRDEHSVLRILQLGQDDSSFAYALVIDRDGRLLNAVNSPSIDPGTVIAGTMTEAWSGERELALAAGERRILEFFAPIIDGGQVLGTVRVGYFLPGFGLSASELPLLGSLALTIFLLTPLFYFSVRKEIQPLKAVNDEIASKIDDGQFSAFNIEASGELREFIERFNAFMGLARARIDALEQSNSELATSQKLLTYRKLRIEAVLKAIPEAVLVLGEDGSVTYANSKVKELLGVEPAEILHRKPSEWCAHDQALEFLSRFEKSTTSSLYSDTTRLASPIVEQKKLSIKAYPLFSPKDPDSVFGRLIVLRDITKEVLAEEGRSNFVAHVAHELKNPLHTLALYAEALQGEQGDEPGFRIEAYNVIHDEVERLASLVDNLLNITKIEMGSLKIEKQRVRLQDLLRDAFQHVAQSGRAKGLKFDIDMPPELSSVAIDKDLLRIAINNLLVNAVKYTPAGGRVSLSATETETAIEIRVTDTGIGIAAEDQPKIFEKFYRANSDAVREAGGHGLGLPLAKEIIELHRGEISVSSAPGEGSEFLVSFWKDSGLLKQAI